MRYDYCSAVHPCCYIRKGGNFMKAIEVAQLVTGALYFIVGTITFAQLFFSDKR